MPHTALHEPVTRTDASTLDHSVEQLLSGLEWQGCDLHVGQYCGPWTASTAGHQRASFHLVLHGHCHLHRPGLPSLHLGPRDGVFLLQDQAHHLSPSASPTPAPDRKPPQPTPAMQHLRDGPEAGTGLACGFFEFKGAYSQLLRGTLPTLLVVRADSAPAQQLDALFTLLLAEARQAPHAANQGDSPVIRRLIELIFFQVLRQHARSQAAQGLWSLVSEPALLPLLDALMRQPELDWTADTMARHVHMSRARFFRVFTQACGQSPAQFLANLRMQLAARQLDRGANLARTAQAVGYQSYAAFSRTFKKVIGQHPGGYQRRDPAPLRAAIRDA